MEKDLLYKKEVYEIIGAAIEVHKELGSGFLESVYEETMFIESKKRKKPHETQVQIPIYYKGKKLNKKFIADYVGYDKIIVELKCIPQLIRQLAERSTNY